MKANDLTLREFLLAESFEREIESLKKERDELVEDMKRIYEIQHSMRKHDDVFYIAKAAVAKHGKAGV